MSWLKRLKPKSNYIAIYATLILFAILFLIGCALYPGFGSWQVVSNLFIDNAFLIVLSIGEMLTILTAGIDLSVGAMVAFISMIAADLLRKGINAYLVMLFVLLVGVVFGAVQGFLIVKFDLHPWIVTLAGMFFARGASYLISIDTIPITDPTFTAISSMRVPLGGSVYTSINAIVSVVVVIAFIYILKHTKFGRTVYAIGGNQNSARLMGLSVDRVKFFVYVISGFCSALGGLIFTIYKLSGYGLHCNGTEMDAIAACVVGGIILTGGSGYAIGPMLGVLVTGLIQNLITFNGTLNSWWTIVAVGGLLFIFIALQRIIVIRGEVRSAIAAKSSSATATVRTES